MTMFRISKDKNNPYVIVNKGFVNDASLSWKAKGVLLYLLSKPDDWQVYESDIVKHSTDGRDSVRTALSELITCGYIKRTRKRDELGRLSGYEYVVSEVPDQSGKSDIGESNVGESPATNNDGTKNNQTKDNNDNGSFPERKQTINTEVIDAMKVYMNDLYPQRKKKHHPFLIPEQYNAVYTNIAGFVDEHCLDYEALIEMMLSYINDKTLDTDWNINHFATEGIMLNRFYNAGLL